MSEIIAYRDIKDIPQALWDDLCLASDGATVFQSYGWQAACLASRPDVEPLMVAVYGQGSLQMIAPLWVEQEKRRRVLRFIGNGRADYGGFIIRKGREESLSAALSWLRADCSWDEMEFNNIPAGSPADMLLPGAFARAGLRAVRGWRMPCLSVDLAAGAKKFLANDNLRRSRRKLEEFGLEVRHLTGPEEILGWLNVFFIQHIQRWVFRSPQSLFIDPMARRLYRAIVKEMAPSGRTILSVLLVKGRPAAFHFGFLDGKKMLWYKPSFDGEWARYSPGDLLLQEAILWAQEQGIRELDLTRGTEIYKTRFRTERHLNVSFVASRSWARCGWRSLVGIARDVPAAVWLAALMKDVGRCVHQILFARSMVDRSRWTKGSQATNEAYYAREGVVEAYARETGLQRPEITVLNELKPRLASMRMLDIGVGTGRTSVYFAPLVKAYTGLDHSRAMVDMARRLNMDLVDPSCFIEGDARAMTQVPDGSVDLVLMSFNGIDSMPSSGRAQVLAEVRRVLGSGGTFVFSSHNLQSVLFSWQGGFREALRRIGRSAVMAAANPGLKARASAGSSMLFDIAGDYRVPIHHTTPLAQQQELEAAGFAGVRVFSLDSGHEVPSERFSGLRDNWIYYLCQRP